MWEKVQSERPQLREVKSVHIAAEATRTAAEFKNQLLTSSEWTFRAGIGELSGLLENLGVRWPDCF